MMKIRRNISMVWLCILIILSGAIASTYPHRILVDTDVDTDDIFALLYLLKLNTSEFDLKV
ncbi:hypothetical protein KSS87_004136 [Heliosperma pusillum]|nr:hypothetical protein KSS87_022768 [Heliosperma pusillum]KAH9621222.1 hypothetical protein KSS87_004136 [Heliosperma pusillum]